MDVLDFINRSGQKEVRNPLFNPKSKKNIQPRSIVVQDLTPDNDAAVNMAIADEVNQFSIDSKTADKYRNKGFNYNTWENLDKQLAEAQGTGEKLWNSLKQTVWSEIVLGTLNGFADLYDVMTGAVFQSDNDYQNPVSRYFEEARENYRNNNPIYVDPDKHLTTGGLTDAGWWLSNLPSIASSLTLLIPGKALTAIPKVLKVGKLASYTRKAATGARKIKSIEDAEKLGKVAKWVNKESTITATNKMFENGLTATAMRTLENYQEARQVYNDMYNEASTALNKMSNEDYNSFTNKYAEELQGINTNDRDTVARQLAHNSATKTFMIDYGNILFDVAQVYALRNPLKLTKNMRATAATRKAERLARRNAGKSAEEIAKLDANEKLTSKIKNYAKDHVGALGVFGAEASESIEEAVNSIASEEGMYYGRVMIDPKNNPETTFGSRLSSYLTSPELYDAAFWGLMGGVVFQGAGSGFNRVSNAVIGKIKERKGKNDKTKEDTYTSWKDRFETAENKRRVGEINGRQQSYDTLVEQLTAIEENRNPFGKQGETLDSDEAKQIARDRAIDEYIVGMTFRAIDAGNYDLLKEYLRDENVRKALVDKGVIDSNANVDDFIRRMDEVEQIYNDNLIAIDGISQGLNVPFEYIQIIGRDNAMAQVQQQRLDKQLVNYEVSAENNKRRFGSNLDGSIDYKSAVELAVTTRRLAELRAAKRAILEDSDYAKSIDGQNKLNDIDKQIKLINENIASDSWNNLAKGNTSFGSSLARLIWANVTSTQGNYDANGKFKQDTNTDDYRKAMDALLSQDMNALRELTGINFKTTDEDIISLFGEDGASGAYHSLSYDLNAAFNVEKSIDKLAPNLNEDYQNIAAIKLAKLEQQAKIANTTETINMRINELHNSMNEARTKAISLAEKDIFDIVEKYGNLEVEGYLFENADIENISEADKKKLDDALEVLNLTADSNRVLGENLKMILFNSELNKRTNEAIQSEENATNNQAISDTENLKSNNPITDTTNEKIGQEESVQQHISNNGQQVASVTGNIAITPNIDGGIDATTNVKDSDEHYIFSEDENGVLTLSLPKGKTVPDNMLRTQYDGYDAEMSNKGIAPKVISHPKLRRTEDGYEVIERGKVEYITESPSSSKPASTNLSTGDVVDQDSSSNNDSSSKLNNNSIVNFSDSDEANTKPEVAPISVTDEYIENIENTIQQEANELSQKRDKTKDANEVLEEIKAALIEKHKNDEQPNIVENAINRSIKILRARYTRRGLIKSAAEVLSSSVTEMPGGRYDFSQAYKDAVVKMIEEFCKENGIREIGGKRYINLEEVLRRINTLFEDKHIANMMYGAINAYLKTEESKSRFVVMDDTDAEHFLANVAKSAKQRQLEQLGSSDSNIHRVNIDRLFENPSTEFLEAFDSISTGDILSIRVENGEIKLAKNEVVVGTLPKPLIDSSTGSYYKWNKGWKTVVYKENGIVLSNLADIFSNILLEENDTNNTINDSITELNAVLNELRSVTTKVERKKELERRKDELTEKVYNILKNDLHLVGNIISESADNFDVVEYMCNLWRYADVHGAKPDERQILIEDSLNSWYEKLYNEYDGIIQLSNNIENNGNIVAKVEEITAGEVIRIIDNDNRGDGQNYDKYTQANSAFANPSEITLSIVDPNNIGQIITSKGEVIQGEFGKSGTVTIVMPDKNGANRYITGISVNMNDSNLTGDAKKIVTAIKKELNYLIDKHIKEGNYQALFDFLRELCYDSNRYRAGQLKGFGINTSLLTGINIWKNSKDDNFFNIGISRKDKTGTTVSIHGGNTRTFNFKRNGEDKFIDENKNRSLNNEEDAKLFKELLNEIIDSASINISMNYINADSKGYKPSGFATSTNGKFNIYIPNSANPSEAFNKTYDSFQDAVINGGLIRVNTKVENGSNFRRKAKNQKYNQRLQVSLVKQTTSPVESNNEVTINTNSNVENTLRDNTITDKANAILKDEFTEEQLKSLNDLHLLPENIIFDENFNKQDENGNWTGLNARASLKQKTTTLGKRWVDMFNEEGEFAGYEPGAYKRQAIRKLIHEQLHHRLYQSGKRDEYLRKIEEIYNDFRNSLDSLDEETRNRISKYLFSDEISAGNKHIALEEFLVESLTSEELVNYLNSVDAEFEKKKLSNNLWQRILKVLSDIFGWEIRKGSLREKELYALQGQLKNIRQAIDNVGKQKTVVEETKQEEKVDDKQETTTETNEESKPKPRFRFGQKRDTRGSSIAEVPKSDYTPEMDSIKEKAIANGTFMKAPNGKPTNLTERQWLQVRTKAFKNWFGNWENPFNFMTGFNIIFGHPAIGKTTALQGKYKDRFIDWDVEYNEKRDRWIEEHTKTKKGTKEFKDARNKYLIYPNNYPDYIEFLTREWNRVKNKAKQENKILLVSPHNLLKLFPNDFNYIIDVESNDFISRNINRGGNETNSKLWKEGIDKTISNVNSIPKYTIGQGIYISDLLDDVNNVSKVVDDNGEPLVVYHSSTESFEEFKHGVKDNTGAKDAKNMFYFSSNKSVSSWYTDMLHGFNKYTSLNTVELENKLLSKLIEDKKPIYSEFDYDSEMSYGIYPNGVVIKTFISQVGSHPQILEINNTSNSEFFNSLPNEMQYAISNDIVEHFDKELANDILELSEYNYEQSAYYDESSGVVLDAKRLNTNIIDKYFIRSFFLNIKDIKEIKDYEGKVKHSIIKHIEENKDKDGFVIINTNDSGTNILSDIYAVRESNQIQSATDNTGEFSTTNNDIKHSSGTEQPNRQQSVQAFTERLPIEEQAKFMRSVARGDISTACR